MQTMQRKPLRALATLAVGTVLAIGFHTTASAAMPDSAAPMHGDHKMEHDWARHRQEKMKERLAKAAERLGIQPEQQSAWQAYANAVESPLGNDRQSHDATDAASIARHRADNAAAYAAKMMNIAETTASLQAVLTPEQQPTFNKMVQHEQRRGHRGWHRPHSPQHDNAQQPGSKSGESQPAATYR